MPVLRVVLGLAVFVGGVVIALAVGNVIARPLRWLTDTDPDGFVVDGMLGLIAGALASMGGATVWALGGWVFSLLGRH